jgi:peroxiredoxin
MIVAGNRVGHELVHRREQSEMADRVSRMNSGESTALRAGNPLPSVSLVAPTDSTGAASRVNSRELVAGREALVFFMSTNCEPCAEAVRRWSESAAELPPGVVLFGVIDQPPDARDAYVSANAVVFPVFSDSADVFGREWGVEVYPTVVATDANGTMVFVRHGVDEGLTPLVALEILRAGIVEGD